MTSCTNAGIMKVSENHGKNRDLMPHVQLPRNQPKTLNSLSSTQISAALWNVVKHECVCAGANESAEASCVSVKGVSMDDIPSPRLKRVQSWSQRCRSWLLWLDLRYKKKWFNLIVLMQIAAAFLQVIKRATRNPQFMHDQYAFKKCGKHFQKWLDCQPHFHCLELFPE